MGNDAWLLSDKLLKHKDLAEVCWHFLDIFALHPHNYRPLFEIFRTIASVLIDPLALTCPMPPSFLHAFGSSFLNPKSSLPLHKVHIFLVYTRLAPPDFFLSHISLAFPCSSLWTTCIYPNAPCSFMLSSQLIDYLTLMCQACCGQFSCICSCCSHCVKCSAQICPLKNTSVFQVSIYSPYNFGLIS